VATRSSPEQAAKADALLRVVLLRKVPEESSLQRRWNDLVAAMKRPEVFYTCEWALAVQYAYQASRKPLIFLGYDGDELVGVACLCTDPAERKVSFLTATTADYCDFLSRSERRSEFVEAVFAELRHMKVESVEFANLPADSATPPSFRHAAKKYGFHLHMRPAYWCSQVKLGDAEQRAELKTTVARKRQFKRCLKMIEREGPVTLSFLRSWSEIEPMLPVFAATHVARFRTTKHTSFLSAPERRVFMEDLARRSTAAGLMTMTVLKVGERPLAWSYGFQFHGVWFLYQTTFDTRGEENSPGYCLLAKILMEACDTNTFQMVDLGLGAEVYKEWFANTGRQTLHAMLTTSGLRYAREVARYRIATKLKRFPKLEAAIRETRSRLRF
jgi:CelD/BcsL family acetyltransferase involved in cellulose biosynthesis